MTNIYDEIINGNLDLLDELTDLDKQHFITDIVGKNPNKKEILNKLLPKFRNSSNWYNLSYEIFGLIYLDNDFKEYTFYLLHNEYVKIVYLSLDEMLNILRYTGWGFDYILYNLDKCLDNPVVYIIIEILVNFIKDKPNYYKIVKEKIMSLNDQEIRDKFIRVSLRNGIILTEDDIKANLYKNVDSYYYHQEVLPFCSECDLFTESTVPLYLAKWIEKYHMYKDMIINNFDLFMTTEQNNKMEILEHFYSYLPDDIKDKYADVYRFYKAYPITYINHFITILMNNGMTSFLNDLLYNNVVSYLNNGSTTYAFKIGDSVLKLSETKHELDTIKDLFLLAPTDTKYIYDSDGNLKLVVEVQKYLEKTHNGIDMTVHDIDNFFKELDNLGYTLTDPNCRNKYFENFGFLDDYHDANLVGVSSYEDLPEWFKERPIVLYDIDLVYKKDYKNKKFFR